MREPNVIMAALPTVALARRALAALVVSQEKERIRLDDGMLLTRYGDGAAAVAGRVGERVAGVRPLLDDVFDVLTGPVHVRRRCGTADLIDGLLAPPIAQCAPATVVLAEVGEYNHIVIDLELNLLGAVVLRRPVTLVRTDLQTATRSASIARCCPGGGAMLLRRRTARIARPVSAGQINQAKERQ